MDVLVERKIPADAATVARIMFDPDNDPKWIGGARSVERLTPGPIGVGSRVKRNGGFLGRKFSWVTEVTAVEPDRRLEMVFLEGPMTGEVAYLVRPTPDGALAAIRNRGAARFELPGMAWMVRRSVAADLRRLSDLVQRTAT